MSLRLASLRNAVTCSSVSAATQTSGVKIRGRIVLDERVGMASNLAHRCVADGIPQNQQRKNAPYTREVDPVNPIKVSLPARSTYSFGQLFNAFSLSFRISNQLFFNFSMQIARVTAVFGRCGKHATLVFDENCVTAT